MAHDAPADTLRSAEPEPREPIGESDLWHPSETPEPLDIVAPRTPESPRDAFSASHDEAAGEDHLDDQDSQRPPGDGAAPAR